MPDERRNRWPIGGSNGGSSGDQQPRRLRSSAWIVIIGITLAFLLFSNLFAPRGTEITLSRFEQIVEGDRIAPDTQVLVGQTEISGTFLNESGSEVRFRATLPPNYDPEPLLALMRQKGIQYTGSQPSALTQVIGYLIFPLLLIGLLYFLFFRRMAGGASATALNLGRNKVKIYDRKEMKTTFDDVAGLEEAREELEEIVDFLKNPKKYQRLGGRIPKGVLLLGPPGCGKTLLARAVAGEAGVPFFFMSGSEFVEMFVGLGAARVRELFQQAKEKAPALVFLDELDTIGKGRMGGVGAGLGSHDEREQTLNQLLVEMDGFDSSKGVIIMAATNRPDVLDPALVRPGRFDRQVVVDRPDLNGREAILKVHARGVSLDPSVDLRVIAARTPGFTGADLANIVNEAALLAARREKDAVTTEELEEAIDRGVAGLERKSRVMSAKERERVAKHEMGHAIVALVVPNADPLHRVSIVPRGAAALGMTMQRPLEDRYMLTEPQLRDQLAILLGGRTAEEICFGEISTGAQNDLEKATEIARAMVVEYGMSDKVGPLSFGHNGFRSPEGRMLFPGERPEMSEATAQLVDTEVKALVSEAHERATQILTERRAFMEQVSALLMVKEVIEGSDLQAYLEGTAEIPEPGSLPGDGAAAEPEPEPGAEADTQAATQPQDVRGTDETRPLPRPEDTETRPLERPGEGNGEAAERARRRAEP